MTSPTLSSASGDRGQRFEIRGTLASGRTILLAWADTEEQRDRIVAHFRGRPRHLKHVEAYDRRIPPAPAWGGKN